MLNDNNSYWWGGRYEHFSTEWKIWLFLRTLFQEKKKSYVPLTWQNIVLFLEGWFLLTSLASLKKKKKRITVVTFMFSVMQFQVANQNVAIYFFYEEKYSPALPAPKIQQNTPVTPPQRT